MLVPHGREDAELGERRLAADQLEDALVFVGLEPVLGDEFGGDGGFGADHVQPGIQRLGPALDIGADAGAVGPVRQRAVGGGARAGCRLHHERGQAGGIVLLDDQDARHTGIARRAL